MTSLLCITTEMDDARSCTHKDQHVVYCDGNEYRYNPVAKRDEATGKPCAGCRPREAAKGLLCASCWMKVLKAFEEWTPERRALLALVDRAVQRDNGGVRSGPEGYVPIPGTKLALDEIASYLRTFKGNVDYWVSTTEGAKDAVRFGRAVPVALRTHELEEKPHKVKRTRCSKCGQLTLVWHPTEYPGHHVRVICGNPDCGLELDQTAFDTVAQIEEQTSKRRKASA